MKDLRNEQIVEVITEAIDRKEGREVRKKCPLLVKRPRFHDLLQAARVSINEADELNRNLESSIEDLNRLMEDAAGSILEASELLEEQAQQLL
jgi:hypothetical protein